MNIKIGPYLKWWGPYQIADLLQKVGVSEDTCEKIGEKMPDWVTDVCQWVYDKRNRNIKIHIDKWDTWSMDTTLAYIIVPMLKNLRDSTNSYPTGVNVKVVNENDWSAQEIFKGKGFEYPENAEFDAWKENLNKMIWAFEQLLDDDWEDQYRTGEIDVQWVETDSGDGTDTKYSTMVDGPKHTLVTDYDGIRKHADRMKEGFALFGKYYWDLWD